MPALPGEHTSYRITTGTVLGAGHRITLDRGRDRYRDRDRNLSPAADGEGGCWSLVASRLSFPCRRIGVTGRGCVWGGEDIRDQAVVCMMGKAKRNPSRWRLGAGHRITLDRGRDRYRDRDRNLPAAADGEGGCWSLVASRLSFPCRRIGVTGRGCVWGGEDIRDQAVVCMMGKAKRNPSGCWSAGCWSPDYAGLQEALG